MFFWKNRKKESEELAEQKMQEYFQKLNEIGKETHYTANPRKEVDIRVTFNNEKGKDFYNQIKDDKDFGIEVADSEIQRKRMDALLLEYQETLKTRGVGGSTGGDFSLIYQFYDVAKYVGVFLFSWALTHIYQDIDEALWNRVKEIFKKAFVTFKSNVEPDQEVVLVIKDVGDIGDIVFLFDHSLNGEDLEIQLVHMLNMLRELRTDLPDDHVSSARVYRYERPSHIWRDVTEEFD